MRQVRHLNGYFELPGKMLMVTKAIKLLQFCSSSSSSNYIVQVGRQLINGDRFEAKSV